MKTARTENLSRARDREYYSFVIRWKKTERRIKGQFQNFSDFRFQS